MIQTGDKLGSRNPLQKKSCTAKHTILPIMSHQDGLKPTKKPSEPDALEASIKKAVAFMTSKDGTLSVSHS